MPLYLLTEADLDLILPWRNAPAVRRNMYSHHEIAPDEHQAWFERMQQDPGARWVYSPPSGTNTAIACASVWPSWTHSRRSPPPAKS